MNGKVKIGDREIRYKVRRGNSSKYLSLRLKPDLELEIILPRKMKLDIKEVLERKRAWIEKKCNELLSKKRIFDGNQILFKGVSYDIKVIQNAKRPAIELDREARTITIHVGERIPSVVLKKWMQKRTRDYVRGKVNDYAKVLGVEFNGIFIRSMKKWGSCSRRGNLSFNWQLIALPKKLAEYVIIHEVLHLIEFNHSKSFRRKMMSLCTDYQEREKMLKGYLSVPFASFNVLRGG